jgi:T5SS/PEP-CTERM-associated repeat protein
VGQFGIGKLTLGGLVDVSGVFGSTHVGGVGVEGTIHFENGVLKTRSLRASFSQFTGIGTINTNGLQSDVELVFDQNHGRQQQFTHGNVTINLDMNGNGRIAVPSLTIADGLDVSSYSGTVPSDGSALITGNGSTWRNNVGLSVAGSLIIESGGKALGNPAGNSLNHVGRHSDGAAIITGAGSSWTSSFHLYLGYEGDATLSRTVVIILLLTGRL